MDFQWSFISNFGMFLVTIWFAFSIRALILAVSLSQRRGVISLSFKKGDRLDPRNWRPITLLNMDYKLAARVIAGRLLKVILLTIKIRLVGFPIIFIGENVALLRDVVEFRSSSGTLVAILSLLSFFRVVPCPLFFMSLSLRSLRLISVAIPVLLAFVSLVPSLCPPYLSMLTTPRSS